MAVTNENVDTAATFDDVLDVPATGEATGAVAPEAGSSPAADVAQPKSVDDIIQDVVAERGEQPSSGEEKPEPQEDDGQDADVDSDASAEDIIAELTRQYGKNPRFREVLRQNKAYKAESENYRELVQYTEAHGITPKEFNDGVEIMALMKRDPVQALARLEPMVLNLMTMTGRALPPDLHQRVQNGSLSVDDAKVMSKQRAELALSQRRFEFDTQLRERQQAVNHQQALAQAADGWQARMMKADPTFLDKARQVPFQKELAWMIRQEGAPTTPQGVIGMLERAKKATAAVAPAQTGQQPRRALTPITGGRPAATNAVKPRSTVDVIDQQLAASRGR